MDDKIRLMKRVVRELCDAIPGVLAVYRFGTTGTSYERMDSDLDLAVLAEQEIAPERRFEIAQQVAVAAGRDVDVVDLRTASTVVRAQVVANGERLFCQDSQRCDRFEDQVYSSYARLNEERRGILMDIRQRGTVYDG